ncbi:MAG: hypothetical protein A2X58_05860 [Nitrospirae bacterium GWC2_56_14]|nr:MAG: hypothetical protein A2X58_05860 [Nitrospirae bacterium GWC2_56_14]
MFFVVGVSQPAACSFSTFFSSAAFVKLKLTVISTFRLMILILLWVMACARVDQCETSVGEKGVGRILGVALVQDGFDLHPAFS